MAQYTVTLDTALETALDLVLLEINRERTLAGENPLGKAGAVQGAVLQRLRHDFASYTQRRQERRLERYVQAPPATQDQVDTLLGVDA